jgi:hypothetical protein
MKVAVTFGDVPGHEFHGNQWTGGGGAELRGAVIGKVGSKNTQIINPIKQATRSELNRIWEADAQITSGNMQVERAKGFISPTDPSLRTIQAEVNVQRLSQVAGNKDWTRGEPIEVMKIGSNLIVTQGNHRVAAARLGGMERVPVLFLTPKGKSKFGAEQPMLLKDAEIFQAGNWPGQNASKVQFTEGDLDAIVSSFSVLSLAGRVPLKLGHDGADVRTSDSAPALGWVEAVRRSGNKLLADIRLTSDKLAEGIRAGAYKFVSIELLRNVQAHTRQIPWVLDAVALLGASAPAVGTLRELSTSMQSFRRAGGLRFRGERLAFKREDVNPSTGDTTVMDEAAVQAAIAKAVKDASEGLTTKFTAQVNELTTKLSTAEAETKKAQATAHRFAVLAPLEAAIKSGELNAAAKDKFITFNGLTDDTKVMLTTVAQAETFVKDAKEMPQYKGPGAPKRGKTTEAEDTAKFTEMSTAEVVTFRVHERVLKLGEKITDFDALERAQRYVLSADRHLATQYFANHAAQYEAPATDDKAA